MKGSLLLQMVLGSIQLFQVLLPKDGDDANDEIAPLFVTHLGRVIPVVTLLFFMAVRQLGQLDERNGDVLLEHCVDGLQKGVV